MEIYSTKAAAEYLGIPRSRFVGYVNRGRITPDVRLPRARGFLKETLDGFAPTMNRPVGRPRTRPAREKGPPRRPPITEEQKAKVLARAGDHRADIARDLNLHPLTVWKVRKAAPSFERRAPSGEGRTAG